MIDYLYQQYTYDLLDKTDINSTYNIENKFMIDDSRIALANLISLVDMDNNY